MARLPRYSITNQPHLVIQRGRDATRIFDEEQDYQYYHDCLEAAAYNYEAQVHAYALLPTEVHILITPKRENSISRCVQSIGRNYVQYYNECHGDEGSLWEGRYRATVIDIKPYLLTCYRHIELSPVRAGLVEFPAEYRWSSYANNADGIHDDMITPHREYLELGITAKARARVYRTLFRRKISDETTDLITESTLKGWALGDLKFARRIEKRSGRRAVQLPKGRPASR